MLEYDKKKQLYFSAAIGGDPWSLADLLKKDPSLLNEVDEHGFSAIMLAADNRKAGVVSFLMRQPGINVQIVAEDGISLAHISAYQQRLDWLEDLSKEGVSFVESGVEKYYHLAQSALDGARLDAEETTLKILRFLVERGANVSPDLRFGLSQKNAIELAEGKGFLKVKSFLEEVNLTKIEKAALEQVLDVPKFKAKPEEHEENGDARGGVKRSKAL